VNPAALPASGELAGRVLLALLFIAEAFIKLSAYDGAVRYAEAYGVPGWTLPLAIVLELGGGLLIAIGWQTRLLALAFAGFCLSTALIFHTKFSDGNQLVHFLKDVALIGAFLTIAARGTGAWSVDAWLAKRRAI